MQAKNENLPAPKKHRPFLRRVLLLAGCILFLQGADTLLHEGLCYYAEDSRYAHVAECYAPVCTAAADAASTVQRAPLEVDFAALQSAYPYVVAWLTLDNTKISYPILQGQDNSYYLNHALDGTATKSGAVFLDCRCAQSDPYWIVYGHNMKDRSMFGSLREWKQESTFRQAGGGLTLYTPEHIWRYQIFSVRVVSPEDETFLPRTQQNEAYGTFLQTVQKNALYDTDVSCTQTDKVLVLSTCTGSEGTQRLVLYARRISELTN